MKQAQGRELRIKEARIDAKKIFAFAAALLLATPLTGCLVVGGSSRGGMFIWPGGLGALVIILVVVLLLRRR